MHLKRITKATHFNVTQTQYILKRPANVTHINAMQTQYNLKTYYKCITHINVM